MPTQVWKCDHCMETNESFDEASNHEKECSFNPVNRYCYSCSNHSNDGFYMFGESYTCLKNQKMDHYEDVGGCPEWKKE